MSPEMLYIMGLKAGEGGCTAEQRIGVRICRDLMKLLGSYMLAEVGFLKR